MKIDGGPKLRVRENILQSRHWSTGHGRRSALVYLVFHDQLDVKSEAYLEKFSKLDW